MGAPSRSRGTAEAYPGTTGWTGWVVFAGIMMVLLGMFHLIDGLIALFQDDYYLVGESGLTVHASYTAWGWVHLIGGVVVLCAGIALFAGMTWARVVAVIVALISAVVNLGFLAAYPVWSLILIALDVVVIMALTVHGSDIKDF